MLFNLGLFAVLFGASSLALAQAPSAPAPASAPIRLSDLPLPAPHLLREHAEAARVQSEIERMQREQSLMQARIAHEQAQRQMRQAMGTSDLPKVVAVLGVRGEDRPGRVESRALLRSSNGVEVIVAVGDRVGRGMLVQSIEADGVVLTSRIGSGKRARNRLHHLQFASMEPEPLPRAALPTIAGLPDIVPIAPAAAR